MKQSCFFSQNQVFTAILRYHAMFFCSFCIQFPFFTVHVLFNTHTKNLIGEFVIICIVSGASEWYPIEQAQSYKVLTETV